MAHKRPIPQVPRTATEHGRVAFDSAVKEDLEVLMGIRVALIKPLAETAILVLTADSASAAAATATLIAAADSAAAAAATSTVIAAALPAAAPAGGVGAAAGGWDTAANRDAAIVTINDLRTMNAELKLDHDALLADVADIRTKYAAVVTLANEMKADFNALLVDVADIRTKYNSAVTLINETKADVNQEVLAVTEKVNAIIDRLQ